MSAALARYPIGRNAGPMLFGSVLVFGLATVVFGVSTNLALSLIALGVLGGSDLLSMIIRQSMVQLRTPDAMRGRVSAVHSLFTGTSNQLGEFESGLLAALFGAVPAVLIGGHRHHRRGRAVDVSLSGASSIRAGRSIRPSDP